ncbi:MAG: hypothetical protein OEZ68_16290 [Gammaproteobacteria bacterium]|nr:hypothetical protein [Gammaproteobacteria bacterium]MDH5802361.1 hypothetical protein [Gammaproteobacteria bacterium]
MPTWYSVDLGDGIDAFAPSKKIKQEFYSLFERSGKPNNMAVFSRYDLKSNCFTVYFSPLTAELAVEFSATPCDKPEFSNNLSLLAGHNRSISELFPLVN